MSETPRCLAEVGVGRARGSCRSGTLLLTVLDAARVFRTAGEGRASLWAVCALLLLLLPTHNRSCEDGGEQTQGSERQREAAKKPAAFLGRANKLGTAGAGGWGGE